MVRLTSIDVGFKLVIGQTDINGYSNVHNIIFITQLAWQQSINQCTDQFISKVIM